MNKKMIVGNIEPGAAWKGVGTQQITGAAAPVLAVPANTRFCMFSAEVTTWRVGNVTTITSTLGPVIHPLQPPLIWGGDPNTITIACTTGAGVLNVHYFK